MINLVTKFSLIKIYTKIDILVKCRNSNWDLIKIINIFNWSILIMILERKIIGFMFQFYRLRFLSMDINWMMEILLSLGKSFLKFNWKMNNWLINNWMKEVQYKVLSFKKQVEYVEYVFSHKNKEMNLSITFVDVQIIIQFILNVLYIGSIIKTIEMIMLFRLLK